MSLVKFLLPPQSTEKPEEKKPLDLKMERPESKLHLALLSQYAAEFREKPLAERTVYLKAFADASSPTLIEALSRALDMELRLMQHEDTVLDIFTEMSALCSADNTVAIEIFNSIFKPIIQSAAALNKTTIFFQSFQQIINLCAGDPVLCEMIGLWYECKIQNPAVLGATLQIPSYIKHIDICTLNDEEFMNFIEALKKNTTLKSLTLQGIDTDRVIALAEILKENKTLISLNLSHVNVSDFGIESLGESLKMNKTLKELHLNSTTIEYGIRWIAQALILNQTLSSLDLKSCKIPDVGIKCIASALTKNTSLQKLNLSSTNLNNEGLNALAEALKVNNVLESLDLSHNNIDSANATFIAESLKVNKSLRSLNLSGNRITDAGAFALAEAITLNPSLTRLEIRGNSMSDISKRALEEAFAQNPSIASIDT